jgi:hypothetical protein
VQDLAFFAGSFYFTWKSHDTEDNKLR